MYIPKLNEETRVEVLHGLMAAHPLATLVTVGAKGLIATHLPMVLEGGVLKGHIARANTQWREFDPEVEALAIFQRADHYISPNWYPEKNETGEVVPTWAYAVVHVYGRLRLVEDAEWMMGMLERLTDIHEAGSAAPWRVSDAPAEYIRGLLKRVIGVELTIGRMEGKWKLDQGESERSRVGVVKGLEAVGTPESLAMKGLVEKTLVSE